MNFCNKLECLSLARFSSKVRTLEWNTRDVLHSGKLRPYPQTLDKAGKAYQEQNTLAYYEKS